MQYAYALNRPLTSADATMILGAVYFYLRERDVCKTVAEMHANNQAQCSVLGLRESAFKSAYGRVQS